MLCPACRAEGISFWRLWLFNLRQKIHCDACHTLFLIRSPDSVAVGTVSFVLLSGVAFFIPGGRGLGVALLLFGIVANFVLMHHFVQLRSERDELDERDEPDSD